MNIYLDNAATTQVDEKVLEVMLPYFKENYGNPSSTHSHGRKVKAAVEESRKKFADLLGANPSEIFFTSGGTEGDNTALRCLTKKYDIKDVITSCIEHHAVLHTVDELESCSNVNKHFVALNESGMVDYEDLEKALKDAKSSSLVSLMHGNNEVGNLSDIDKIGSLCKEYTAFFHCDAVQTVGHYSIDLSKTHVHSIVGSAHKFHGPKGVGFMYLKKGCDIDPLILGGSQERNRRAGTENIAGIVGMTKALELCIQQMDEHKDHILGLKVRMIKALRERIPGVVFNGCSDDIENSLYTVLNISLPPSEMDNFLLMQLDLNGVSASSGSACASGSEVGSHVIKSIKSCSSSKALRFSFGRYNTKEDIDRTVEVLEKICSEKVIS